MGMISEKMRMRIVSMAEVMPTAAIDPVTGLVETFADPMGGFPVGVGCLSGPFGKYMYVGNASSVMGGGLMEVDADGYVEPFALDGTSVAGLDFGKGQFGTDLRIVAPGHPDPLIGDAFGCKAGIPCQAAIRIPVGLREMVTAPIDV